MKTLLRLLSYIVGNYLGLYLASYAIPGFLISPEPLKILTVAALLLLGNIFIKPALKLILSPLVILTLGLFTIAINGFVLYLIDFMSDYITINGIEPLLYGTLLISAVTILTSLSLRLFMRELFISQLH